MSAAAPLARVVPVLMPQAGQSMEEGTIVKWRVQPGAAIAKGQIIFEVETDKATVEVEATDAGRLARIVVGEGQTIAVKQPVAYLAENDADVDACLSSSCASAVAAVASNIGNSIAAVTPPAAGCVRAGVLRIKTSPAARKIAAARGVDLTAIGTGSGPGGRILSADVLKVPPRALKTGIGAAENVARRKRLSKMRRAIAANLSASKQTVPHFYARITIEADALLGFYREQKVQAACSLNDVITLACAKVIREFPAFRSQIEGDEIVEFETVNIGIAVGIDEGLIVPVLLDADRLTLKDLAANTRRIVENARAGRLEGAGRGNFTISNLGMFGVDEFAAIINPPEAAILAVGAVREAVLVKDGAMRAGHALTVTLSCDHRVIDGVLAAKFLARLKELLEAPRQWAEGTRLA